MYDLERHFDSPGSQYAGAGSVSYSAYSFYFDPELGVAEKVSSIDMLTVLSAGRLDDDGNTFGSNVPVIDTSGLLNSYGAYSNLCLYSEDISNAAWIKDTGVTITGTDTFQVDSQFDDITQNITTTAGVLYTYSFIASVEVGGNLTDYRYMHNNSASGDNSILTLSETPTQYTKTVLGRAGDGLVSFGIRDNNSSNWAKVTISELQVIATTHEMPYAATTSSTVTISSNNSNPGNTEENAFPIDSTTQGLLDRLDGVADGNELVSTTQSGLADDWTYSNGVFSISNSSGYNATVLNQTEAYSIGDTIEFYLNILTNSGGNGVRVRAGATSSDWITGTGYYKLRLVNTSPADLKVQATTGATIDIEISAKVVSDAQAQMQLEWTPMFDAADIDALGSDVLGVTPSFSSSAEVTMVGKKAEFRDTDAGLEYTYTATGMSNNTEYEASFTIENYVSGSPLYKFDSTASSVLIGTSNGTYIVRGSSASSPRLQVQVSSNGVFDITFNYVKKINKINILTFDDGESSNLYYEKHTTSIKMGDGTNVASVSADPVNGTKYDIELNYGDDSGAKMQLSVTPDGGARVDGSQATFATRFPIADEMKFAYDADEWQKTKILSFKPDPVFP